MAKQENFAGNAFGVIGMLLPLLYFGGLIYYFSGVGGGTWQGIIDIGLGPTVFGLAAIGLLFCIKPLWSLMRLFTTVSSGSKSPSSASTTSSRFDETAAAGLDFDADEAFARYMAKRQSGEVGAVTEPLTEATPDVAIRPAFGRKAI